MRAEKSGNGSATPVSMIAGETKAFALLVIGAADSDVTFSANGLPAFAQLDGAILTLAPGLGDAGSYTFTIGVREGSRSGATTFVLTVRAQTDSGGDPDPSTGFASADAPRWVRGPFLLSDQTRERDLGCPSVTTCSIAVPMVWVTACDPKAASVIQVDAVMHLEVEVVEHGTPFTGAPTVSVAMTAAAACPVGDAAVGRGAGGVLLPMLARGKLYDFAVRVREGDVAALLDHPGLAVSADKGWVKPGSFQQAPCGNGRCACVPTTNDGRFNCRWDTDCCSGSCSTHNTEQPGICL